MVGCHHVESIVFHVHAFISSGSNRRTMGKIKRERQKFHITSMADDDADNPLGASLEVPKYTLPPPAPMRFDVSENIFAGINIQLDKVNKFVEPKPSAEPPAKKDISTKPTLKFSAPSSEQPERQLTKKEKMKLKHEKLLQKIDIVQQAKREHESKKKKKNAKAAIADLTKLPSVGQYVKAPVERLDAQPERVASKKPSCNLASVRKELVSLNDSLPSLDTIYRMKSRDAKTGMEETMRLKSKQRKAKSHPRMDTVGIQHSSKTIAKDTKKDVKKEYVKSYDLFRKLLKTTKTTTNPTKLPKQKKYPKK